MRISRNRIDLEGGGIDQAVLKDYGETLVGGALGQESGATETLNIADGNVFHIVLTEDCTFAFSNPTPVGTACSFKLFLQQDTFGNRSASWPASVIWEAGSAPVLTSTAQRTDVFSFLTGDGGAPWYGFVAGKDYPTTTDITGAGFAGGNQSAADIYALVQAMAAGAAIVPTAGGTLTINSAALGSYDYTIKAGNQTVSAFSSNDWFTTTADSRSAFVVVKGDLTINAAQVFKPSARKLFTVVYVTGALAVNGEISKSQRGANHSAGAGNVAAAAIRIATGTFSSVTNPQVPAAGAGGGTAVVRSTGGSSAGNVGTAGTNGQTGGGGSGGASKSAGGTATSGAGATGTSFSGGPGGGAAATTSGSPTGGAGAANGAAGGNGVVGGTAVAGGGAGNSGGTGAGGGNAGDNGTGGVLIIIGEGDFSGSGSVTAAGADGGDVTNYSAGAGSGGGSVTIMVGGSDTGPTPTALGGAGGTSDT